MEICTGEHLRMRVESCVSVLNIYIFINTSLNISISKLPYRNNANFEIYNNATLLTQS